MIAVLAIVNQHFIKFTVPAHFRFFLNKFNKEKMRYFFAEFSGFEGEIWCYKFVWAYETVILY